MPPAAYKPVSYDDATDMSFVIAAMRDFKR